jgi:uncharacterized protein DUF6316
MRRSDPDNKTYFRSQRIFCTNGQWYFATREGEHGPYSSRSRAEAALATFVNEKVELDRFQESRSKSVGLRTMKFKLARIECLEDDRGSARRKKLIY